ncbi:MAG TPA: DUF4105 domain-containing protein [Kofleriaceae bacterium]|nr:DUF4105 domain-containing protein [Kofleriaceae bacterium]
MVVLLAAGTCAACATRVVAISREHLAPTVQPAEVAYVDELLASSRRLALSARPEWHKLLHYQSTWSGGVESEADGPSFFLAADGKVSPRAELEATLRGLFAQVQPGAPRDVQHPICQFPARTHWLVHELHIDGERLPHPSCDRYEEFRKLLDASSVALVFSSYYLNNPASAFGHTFLLFNSKKSQTDDQRELLDYAVNFSATADTANAVAYAVKGIFGAFPGEFSKVPYYMQVRKYNDFESRDLWLYNLALTPDEIETLVAHIWELGSTWFDYYYATENCSYHILGALEAAVPRASFVERTRIPVAPADTVKIVTSTPGLVTRVTFRPAIRAQVAARVRGLDGRERQLTAALADDPATPWPARLPIERRVKVLDAATDVVDMHFAKELPFDLDGPGARRKQLLLERRAELAVRSTELRVPIPEDKRPDRGHGSRRLGIASGLSTSGDPTLALNARLTLHDLGDPANGYPDTASLEFLPIAARLVFGPDHVRAQLDDAQLVRIVSLSPQNAFEHKMSWKIQTGAVTVDDGACHLCTAFRTSGGAGAALGTSGGGLLGWFTTDVQLVSARGLRGIADAPIRLGVGPAGGVRARLSSDASLLFSGEWIWLPKQPILASYQVTGGLRWRFTQALALSLTGAYQNAGIDGQLGLFIYY